MTFEEAEEAKQKRHDENVRMQREQMEQNERKMQEQQRANANQEQLLRRQAAAAEDAAQVRREEHEDYELQVLSEVRAKCLKIKRTYPGVLEKIIDAAHNEWSKEDFKVEREGYTLDSIIRVDIPLYKGALELSNELNLGETATDIEINYPGVMDRCVNELRGVWDDERIEKIRQKLQLKEALDEKARKAAEEAEKARQQAAEAARIKKWENRPVFKYFNKFPFWLNIILFTIGMLFLWPSSFFIKWALILGYDFWNFCLGFDHEKGGEFILDKRLMSIIACVVFALSLVAVIQKPMKKSASETNEAAVKQTVEETATEQAKNPGKNATGSEAEDSAENNK